MTSKAHKPLPLSGVKTLPCGRPLSISRPKPDESQALLKSMQQKLELFSAEKKLNRSEARSKILEVIVKEARHFKAQDLVAKVQRRFKEVGRSTVYRNLPILLECGLIQEGPTAPDGQALYELSDDDHHDHIVCLDCKNIFEFHDRSIEDKQTKIAEQLGFTVKDHRHVVFASCDRLKR